MNYPEHEKMVKVRDQSQAIGEFLEWIADSKHFRICEYRDGEGEWGSGTFFPAGHYPVRASINDLLAEYFGIDLVVVEREKRAMLERIREGL